MIKTTIEECEIEEKYYSLDVVNMWDINSNPDEFVWYKKVRNVTITFKLVENTKVTEKQSQMRNLLKHEVTNELREVFNLIEGDESGK